MTNNIKILLILVWIGLTTSDHSVQFLSTLNHDQLVTSSTLKWITAENGKVPPNAVVGATRHSFEELKVIKVDNIYICRAMHDAEWIPGQLLPEEKACYISLLGSVKSYKKYEVLQNVENGSRLLWQDWDAYHTYPSGIVAGGIDLYIARKKVGETEDNDVSSQVDGTLKSFQGYSHYLGKFNSKDAFGRMTILTEDKEEKRFIKGQLLIEIEPIRYELNNVKYTLFRRKIQKKRKLLAFTILKNTENIPIKVDSALAYDSSYSSYWGQGNAILKGLTTTIRNSTTGNIIAEIEWGIEENEDRKDVFKVEIMLQPGTAVNVTLWGNETKSELPYIGTLVAFYKDGATTARKIDGNRRLFQVVDIEPEIGSAYFIKNNSLVPTTTTTTTSTTPATTTTAITTTTISGTKFPNNNGDSFNNNNNSFFILHRRNQSNDMLSDDGLLSPNENKEATKALEVPKDSSYKIVPYFYNLISTILFVFTYQRIT